MKLLQKTLTLTALSGIFLSPTADLMAAPQTQVPITRIEFLGTPTVPSEAVAEFVVPDRDTTRSAYGGQLRRYDVHLAKMFELTDYECRRPDRNWSHIVWRYFANNGDVAMGSFMVSCDQAREVAETYGLGATERTTIYNSVSGNSHQETLTVPILDITGRKVPQWLTFVQRIRPELGR